MSEPSFVRTTDASAANRTPEPPATWGPWLFRVALIAALAFFWWLLVYPHGIAAHA